ncbi:MAG: ABC transporter ATP-binding protein [Nitrospiraceae bacterium]|nr:ABC transporter ATP-binding protein [Nitrospiraceae bacterium]
MKGNARTSEYYNGNGGLISLSGIQLSLQDTIILQGVDLRMEKGEIYGMLGPNGAGKSTTISIIAALRSPDRGSASVLGIDPASRPMEVRRRIGVLAENAGFYDWMTGREYLRWFASLYGGDIQGKDANKLLTRVGLDGDSRAPIGGYSRGMKQRLGLARALVNDPELLILDEPTSGLDPEGRRDIHDLLLDLNRNHNIGILLSTHLLDDVERLCGRVGIIHRGRTVLEGVTAALCLGETGTESYRLHVREPSPGSDGPLPNGVSVMKSGDGLFRVEVVKGVPVDSIWRILMACGWNILEIQREERSLEEIYLAAVRKGERNEPSHQYHH